MSIIYNGTTISKLIYNGTEIKTGYWGSTKVYSSIDPTADTFTQDEFIALCDAGLQDQMTVGATITLNNTYCDTYEVIGVNHDGTSGTVDIMSHTQVQSMAFGQGANYTGSTIEQWINGTYLNAFDSSVQNLAKTMTVNIYENGIQKAVSDKVKLLSCTEVNYSDTYAAIEGTAYEAFANATTTTSLRWRDAGSYGSSSFYWLRSQLKATKTSNYVWNVHINGECGQTKYTTANGVLPVLRF